MKFSNIPNIKYRFAWVIVALLAGSNIILLAVCAFYSSRLKKASVASCMNTVTAIDYAERVGQLYPDDSRLNKGPSLLVVCIVSFQRSDMFDKKTALAVANGLLKFPGTYELLDSETRAYVDELDAKWSGKTLGFPDVW